MMLVVYVVLAAYLIWAYSKTPMWAAIHIWVHALYIVFPFEPDWLLRLHDWTGERMVEEENESSRRNISLRGQ